MKTKETISKLISYWLRHDPQDAKFQIDEVCGQGIIEIIIISFPLFDDEKCITK